MVKLPKCVVFGQSGEIGVLGGLVKVMKFPNLVFAFKVNKKEKKRKEKCN